MPELPEVETVVTALRQALVGRRIRNAEFLGKLRLPFDAKAATRRIGNAAVTDVRRRAKYILIDIEGDAALLAHLGMTGYFHLDAASEPRHKHDRLAFILDDGDELRFADARRFGFVKLVELPEAGAFPAELAELGPEPLSRAFSARPMLERAAGRSTPIKVFIMDQTAVVGVGNIYASEALFAAGVDPRRAAGDLSPEEWAALVREVKRVLRRAIRSGGSTIRDYRTVDGTEGGFQRRLLVYGQAGEACPGCGQPIERVRQGGRSTFFCSECQR